MVHARAFSKQCWQYKADILANATIGAQLCENAVMQWGLQNSEEWWSGGWGDGNFATYAFDPNNNDFLYGGTPLYSGNPHAGNFLLCNYFPGTQTCDHDVRHNKYEVHLDNDHLMYFAPGCTDYVTTGPPDPSCDPTTEEDGACVTNCPAEGEHAPNLIVIDEYTTESADFKKGNLHTLHREGSCRSGRTIRHQSDATEPSPPPSPFPSPPPPYNFDIETARFVDDKTCAEVGRMDPRTARECMRAVSRFTTKSKYIEFDELSNGTSTQGFRCIINRANKFAWNPSPLSSSIVLSTVCIPFPLGAVLSSKVGKFISM